MYFFNSVGLTLPEVHQENQVHLLRLCATTSNFETTSHTCTAELYRRPPDVQSYLNFQSNCFKVKDIGVSTCCMICKESSVCMILGQALFLIPLAACEKHIIWKLLCNSVDFQRKSTKIRGHTHNTFLFVVLARKFEISHYITKFRIFSRKFAKMKPICETSS